MNITRVGIDMAKNVFQIHGVDDRGMPVLKKQLKHAQVLACFVNLLPHAWSGWKPVTTRIVVKKPWVTEAEGVKLMAPQFVNPYVKRNKNNAADAEYVAALLIHMVKTFVFPSATHRAGFEVKNHPQKNTTYQPTIAIFWYKDQ